MRKKETDENFSSKEFLARIQRKDETAIEALIRAYTEHLFRGALGLGFDQVMAGEVVQSVWVTFFDIADKFEGRSHVRTFLFGILYNKAAELRREDKRFDTTDPIEEIMDKRFDKEGRWAVPPVNPEEFMVASETMTLIEKCIDSLPLTQRMAFCLREIDDHGTTDICKILSVSVTNLGVLLFRAKNRLRECIEGKAKA